MAKIPFHNPWSILTVVAICLCATGALAKKTDIVVTERGGTFICEIKKLEFGLLDLSLDDLKNRAQVKWAHVIRLMSTHTFVLDIEDGRTAVGPLVEPAADEFVRVRTSEGDVEIHRDEVVSIMPLKDTFAEALIASVSTGISYTKSAAILQFNLGGSLEHNTDKRQTILDVNTIITKDDDITSADTAIPLTHYRYYKNKWFYRGDLAASQNDELGLDFRGSIGGGVGRRLIHVHDALLQASIMVTGNRENTSDDRKTNNLEGVVNVTLKMFRYDTPKVDFDLGVTGYINFTDWGRYRFSANSRFSFELVKDLYWDLGNIYYRYDSDPSDFAASKSDWGIVSGLRYKYN